MMPSLYTSLEGLQVPISSGTYRKERAAQDGLFYWDTESQNVLLTYLGEFLPKVRETDGHGLFYHIVDGKEVCGRSVVLGNTRLPKEGISKLYSDLGRLRSCLNQERLSPEARLIIEKFALPDPERLPEFYRTYMRDGKPELLILWGCTSSEGDLVPPLEAFSKLKKENFFSRHLRTAIPYLTALSFLAIIAGFLWLYFRLPDVDFTLSKETAKPHEPIRAILESKKGDSFSLRSHGTASMAGQPGYQAVKDGVISWSKEIPVEIVDLSYPETGTYSVIVTSSGNLFGIPLPTATRKKIINVISGDTLPTPTQANNYPGETDVIAKGEAIQIRLLSSPKELPARLCAQASTQGTLHLAGEATTLSNPGVFENLSPLKKPGVYRAKFVDNEGKEEEHFIKVLPNDGMPLVANIRTNKAKAGVHESILFDSSSSVVFDPEASILSKELSVDGGNTFIRLNGDYFVTAFSEPGVKNVQLKVVDSKGREQSDKTSVEVIASELPKVTEYTAGGIQKSDIESGARFSIRDAILFPQAQAAVSEEGAKLLKDFASEIANENVIVSVVGHTDDVPISKALQIKFPDNKALSEARAQSAVTILMEAGVRPKNIRAEGAGSQVPRVPNSSPENRAKNRRIEIEIIPIKTN